MIIQQYIDFYKRDLLNLKAELALYSDEQQLWVLKGDIKNSAGNLALHLIGNLNHFIGATIGNTGYIRERDKEFSQKNIPLSVINKNIDALLPILESSISKLKEEQLNDVYPLEFLGQKVSFNFILMQLIVHLNYHLGQINYHRRLLLSE
jgi:hypothetical protein